MLLRLGPRGYSDNQVVGPPRARWRAWWRGSANYVSAAALHRQLAPRPSLCITPHQTSEESSQEGREERGEREQEMRRAEGGDKPYHAMQMRHACTREHMTHAQTWCFLPSPRHLHNHQLSPIIVKRTLGTHLRNTAQSNNAASEFVDPRGSDQPSNSGRHRKAPKVHF